MGTSLALVLVPNTLSPDPDQARALLERAPEQLGRGNEGWMRDVCFADEVPERALDQVLAVFGPGADVVGLDVEDEARQRALRSALRENPECLAVAVTLKY